MKALKITGILVISLALAVPPAISQSSDDTDVSISVDRVCDTDTRGFRLNGAAYYEDVDTTLIGLNSSGTFQYRPSNNGEMAVSNYNISVFREREIDFNNTDSTGNETGDETGNETDDQTGNETGDSTNTTSTSVEQQITQMSNETDSNRTQIDLSWQGANYSKNYLFNSTNSNTEQNLTELFFQRENISHYVRPYRHNTTAGIRQSHANDELIGYNQSWRPLVSVPYMPTFLAQYVPGEYTAELDIDYRCEFRPGPSSDYNVTGDDNLYNESELQNNYNLTELDVRNNVTVDGLNVSELRLEDGDRYANTVMKSKTRETTIIIVDVDGEGVIPDAVGQDAEVDQEVETDAQIPDNATTEFDSDADETLDEADPREGSDSNFPGETEVPQPQPEPQPLPLLSLDIRPINSTYEAPRGTFTEIGLEIENIGEEAVNNVQLEPRFSENMNWEAQTSNIDSLQVGDSVNQSVFVNPGEDVDPGVYQIPVFASNAESDIDNQYVNVEVTEEVVTGTLGIQEVPRDLRFEINQNNSIPVLLQNNGEEPMENVQVELDNVENCGSYSVDPIDSIPAGESASTTVQFESGENVNECSATLVASTDSGQFAFSEINFDIQEEVGVVPQEFRVPIVASLWTVLLLAYAVLTKRYGIHNMTVKVPLVLLVVGEAFIIIYLSSVYYSIMPPGLLPF